MSLDAIIKQALLQTARIHVGIKPGDGKSHTRIQHSLLSPKFPFYNLLQIYFATDASKEDGADSQTTVRSTLHAVLLTYIWTSEIHSFKGRPCNVSFLTTKALCFCQSELVTPADSAKRLHGSSSQRVNAPVLPSGRLEGPLAMLPCSSSSSLSCCSHQDDAKTLFLQWGEGKLNQIFSILSTED